MERFWVYLDGKTQGPFEVAALRKVSGFTLLTQVCREGDQAWRMADDAIEIKSYFLAPPRVSHFPVEFGNTLLAPAPAPLPLPTPAPKPLVLTLEEGPVLGAKPPAKIASGPVPLRATCQSCAYKNPRDLTTCMKCGRPLSGEEESLPEELESEVPAVSPSVEFSKGQTSVAALAPAPQVPMPSMTPSASAPPAAPPPGMIEVPVTKVLIFAALAAVLAGGIFAFKSYSNSRHKVRKAAAKPSVAKPEAETSRVAPTKPGAKTLRPKVPVREVALAKKEAAALPGVSPPERESKAEEASVPYRVIEEAAPLRHRTVAPVDSAYAQKQRASKELWTEQQHKAVQLVQKKRIYGGQRSINRNAEILMQILRDREYTTAFESGRRLYLYNDLDWVAAQYDGPIYDVRLTFSGGREPDGSTKKPLKFAFFADLERGTVEPGGEEQVRSNTLHAFFDESRIPPEERRPIAKDTEELVLASQPEASPLALDTVARQFASTYSPAAMARVSKAYGLSTLDKKLTHDPRVSNPPPRASVPGVSPMSEKVPVEPTPAKTSAVIEAQSKTKTKTMMKSNGGTISYEMTRGDGRDRSLVASAASTAVPGKLWETLTGYDRLKQFVPDLLVSEKIGQDGQAAIVRATFLTRFIFFVFKTNLHLRIIEHPAERTIEFERIAGEFESFRGSAQIVSDPSTKTHTLVWRATIIPKGRMPDWVLRGMAQRFLVPVLAAIRAQAESL